MTKRFHHVLAIAVITAFIAIISRTWTGVDTPDSSFYLSLASFGSEITDRAPFDSYYWTRLGYIAPVRALILLTSPEIGFALYRIILISILVASIYSIVLRFSKPRTTIFLTTAVTLSTVILSYLGNPYLTGFILAATAAVIAVTLASSRPVTAIGAGLIVGWSGQVNPAGALLVGTLFIAVALFTKKPIRFYVIAAITAAVTFVAFIAVGAIIFPGLSWWETFNATRAMNLSDFASNSPVWLADVSLLVPLTVLLLCIKLWWADRSNDARRLALVISSVSITFLLIFSPIMGGIAMEAPMYQAMLWPPAMIALALSVASSVNNNYNKNVPVWVYIASIVAIICAGFVQPTLGFVAGVVIAIGMIALAFFTIAGSTRFTTTGIAVLGLTVFLASAQLLQNSRTDLGLYFLSPYSWAFAPNPIEEKMDTAITVQEWLLANTSDEDQVLTWVDGRWTEGDRELYAVAAMQLWGENRLTLEPVVDDYARAILERTKPSVIALYGRNQEAITTMWESIPDAGPITCTDFDWPTASNTDFPADSGVACLTRLDLP